MKFLRIAVFAVLATAGCAAIDNFFGGPDPRPIPPYVNENASPSETGFGSRFDAGDSG